jgi:hypothetical protein
MSRKKSEPPNEKVGLKLTQAERKLLLDEILLLPEEVEQAIHATPSPKPVMLTLDDLDDLAGQIAATANRVLPAGVQKVIPRERDSQLRDWTGGGQGFSLAFGGCGASAAERRARRRSVTGRSVTVARFSGSGFAAIEAAHGRWSLCDPFRASLSTTRSPRPRASRTS